MKLKYILPVATIASVATIVTPLVTSCSKGMTIDAMKEPDTTNWKQHEKKDGETSITQAVALEELYNNQGLINNDMINYCNFMYNYMKGSIVGDIIIMKMTFSGFKVEKTDNGYYASYNLSCHEENKTSSERCILDIEVQLKKIPLYCQLDPATEENQFSCWFTDDTLTRDDSSARLKETMKYYQIQDGKEIYRGVTSQETFYDKNAHMTYSQLVEAWNYVYYLCGWYSFWFSNIPISG